MAAKTRTAHAENEGRLHYADAAPEQPMFAESMPVPTQPQYGAQDGVPAGFDTLAVCRSFEKTGMNGEEAERLTRQILDIIVAADRRTRASVASKVDLESLRVENKIALDAYRTAMDAETKTLFATLSRNQEYSTNEHDKIRSELKHETEKLIASQRLDLNLEKGRMREEMHDMEERLHGAESKLEKSVAEVKTQLEIAKNDIIRFALGTTLSFVAVGLGVLRFLS